MYRPFVTCDDPKGVVECGTIRRYRTNSQKMKDKTKSRRTAENLETNKPDKEEKVSKGSTERSFDPSSLQLVEVSRGAEKLNIMIESWSRGLRYDGSSEDIAKDLLKGALDLQESLEMLRKVQEASHNMACSKRKQDEKPERSKIDANVMDRTSHSNQLGEQSYSMGFQRGWPSGDCSSSSCREELKKVIKESLVRQNLLPSTSSEGLDSASLFPSTSSSQSSMVWNDRLSDSSLSPTILRKERGPGLVAKLMGIEEVPSRSFPAVMQKQLESQKIINQKRPVFEIDTPKVRRNSSIVEKVNPERQQTLREILQTTHFNGLLKSPVREHKLHVHHSNDPCYKQFDDLPPIVLMKPRYTPYEPVPAEELCFRNPKVKAVPSKTFKPKEGTTINRRKEMEEHVSRSIAKEERSKHFKELGKEMEQHASKRLTKEERNKHFKEVGKEMEEHVSKRVTKEERTKHFKEVGKEMEECVSKRVTKEERTKHFKEVGKEMEEHVSKRLAKEERPKRLKEVVEVDVKEIKPVENEKTGVKVKLYSHASHKSQVSETVDKKAKVKAITISRKPPEKEVSKPKVVIKAQDQGEISSTSAKLRKPQSGSTIDKSEIPSRKSTVSNSNIIPKPRNQNINNSKEQRKNQMKKQRSEPEAAKPVDEQLGQEEGNIIGVSCKDDSAEIKVITTIIDNLTMEQEVVTYESKTRENCQQDQNSSGDDVLMLKCEHENNAIPAEEAHNTPSIRETDFKPHKDSADTTSISETDFKTHKDSAELKYLLLTSQSFIDHAEELLNLDVDYPKFLQKIEIYGIDNIKLYLDCANELTDRKSLQESPAVHPLLLTCAGNSRLHISLDRLVEEVCNAIENLTSYSENSGKKLVLDNIFAMMDRDMKCNNGIWNWGWKHGFSADEAEQVVNEVENLVLSGLIEEVIVNL